MRYALLLTVMALLLGAGLAHAPSASAKNCGESGARCSAKVTSIKCLDAGVNSFGIGEVKAKVTVNMKVPYNQDNNVKSLDLKARLIPTSAGSNFFRPWSDVAHYTPPKPDGPIGANLWTTTDSVSGDADWQVEIKAQVNRSGSDWHADGKRPLGNCPDRGLEGLPTDPTDPTNPTDPTDPTGPINPTDPTNPGGSPPDTQITAAPSGSTTNDYATVYFTSASPGVTGYECKIDSAAWGSCTNPKRYSLLSVGSHTVSVRAVNSAGADPTPAQASWTRIPPDTTITAAPSGDVTRSYATVYFTSNETTDVTFQCKLDDAAWTECSNPKSYSSLSLGTHTVLVRAVVLGAEDPTPAAVSWNRIAPDTRITAGPPNSTSTTGTVYFNSPNDPDATFECRYDDDGTWNACTNPKAYSSIEKGTHKVYVRAVDLGAKDPTPATWTWTRS